MSSPPAQTTSSSEYGVPLIASFVAVSLWALSCMQTFIYFVNYQRDGIAVKLTVIWIWMLSTAHVIMMIIAAYNNLITGFGDFAEFNKVNPEIIWLLLPTTLIALTVQSFFIHRIWIFSSKKPILPGILVLGAIFQMSGNIFTLYKGNTISNLHELFAVDHVMLAYYGVAASVDVTISATMIYLLWKCRLSDGFERSSRILHRLIVLSINSGVWTAVSAIGVLITSIVFENQLTYSIFYFPLAHLYSNCLLANLTARNFIRQRNNTNLTTMAGVNVFQLTPTSPEVSGQGPQVVVSTETLKHSDRDFSSTLLDTGVSKV